MSVSEKTSFDIDGIDVGPLAGNTSILLTGDDTEALEAVFYRLLAPAENERSVVLATDTTGTAVQRTLSRVDHGARDRATVLTCEGPDSGDEITGVEDVSDLTTLGMQFSTLVAEAVQDTDQFRAGILLCSTIMSEVDDTRSVYRFLNSNFMTELRRGDGLGVCAVDTSSDIGSDMNSTLVGLETSFTARVHVESAGKKTATLDVSGLPGTRDTLTVSW